MNYFPHDVTKDTSFLPLIVQTLCVDAIFEYYTFILFIDQ